MTSTACRLMCAASCAYDIHRDNAYRPKGPYDAAVKWSSPPVPYSGGLDTIDACLIGTNEDGLIISFRGTLPPHTDNARDMLDWIQDVFLAKPEAVDHLPGKVHTGFWTALKHLWEPVKAAASKTAEAGTKVYITGHSKGAGIAPLAAARLALEVDVHATAVNAYAPPRCGDSEFVAGFPASVPVTRYENYLDIVPFTPPTQAFIELAEKIPLLGRLFELADGWDYEAVGSLDYIDSQGSIDNGPGSDPTVRFLEILGKMAEDDFGAIAAAHCHACEAAECAGGYMRGACQGTVCRS